MLTVKLYSFSYKKSGIPVDDSPNGGGFVFDCRFIYNPGRKTEFMTMTGKDKAVKDFLDKDASMQRFLNDMYEMINKSAPSVIPAEYCSDKSVRFYINANKAHIRVTGKIFIQRFFCIPYS